jgi:hypothetical protein
MKIPAMQLARVLSAVVLAAAASTACNPEVPKTSFVYGEKRGVITSNGLRFVIMPDKTTSLVQVDVRYEVGSREDPPGKAGLAHLGRTHDVPAEAGWARHPAAHALDRAAHQLLQRLHQLGHHPTTCCRGAPSASTTC